ncbi:restriction endonuclease subunit S [Vibrio splendidus]
MISTYPTHKRSDIEWMEHIPSHWDELKGQFLLRKKDYNVGDAWISTPLLSLTQRGVIKKDINSGKGKTHSDYSTYQFVEKGDLIFCLFDIDETPRTVGLSSFEGMITSAYSVFEAINDNDKKYLYYFFEFVDNCKGLKPYYSGMRKTVRPAEFLKILLPKPPKTEQRAIAAFLDRETQRIDSLIEEKQTFIKLLKEKRQALISHVVTKGLNPSVEVQDSGIEWIGQVPKHWVCPSYKYVCEIYRGKFTHRPRNDPAMFDGIHPFIQTGDVARAKNIISSYSQTLSDAGTEVSQLIPKGTLMMVITGAKIGSTAILGFDSYAPDSVVGFKAKPTIELSYLKYSLMAALPALEQTSIQSTQPNLNIDRIGSLKTPLPPLDEQVSIVNHIENQLSNFETVLSAVEDSIKLLLERRTSLISAAVTGKIDVREAV